MFDWNEEELTNIIWAEADESGDHIVPYPEASDDCSKKKELNKENDNIKPTELKSPGTKVDIHGLESCSNFNLGEGTSTSGFAMDSWPNLSLASDAKTDDSLDNSVSTNLTDISKFDSLGGAETAQLGKDAKSFQHPSEGKDQGDFVDYGWASIGSFDDLDRIFCNGDPIFGNVNLGNTDELWPSSKDITTSPAKSFPLSVGSRTEYVPEDDQLFTLGCGKMNDTTSHVQQSPHPSLNHAEVSGNKRNPIVKEEQTDLGTMEKNTMAQSQITAETLAVPNQLEDKDYKQKKLLRGRKKLEEKNRLKFYPDLYCNWSSYGSQSGEFKNQFAASMVKSSPSPILNQQKQLQGHGQLQYQQISSPFIAASAYGSITNPYSAMPVLSHVQSGQFKDQQLLSGYEISSGNPKSSSKLADPPAKTQGMTPQEKIEKLRRRQQIQAMLAIQKQQQQFGHQVSCSDQSMTPKCSHENQFQHVEGTDLGADDLSNLLCFNPNSPIDQDDSNIISLEVNDYSVEDTILYRLQDIITKLDVSIRLCIRDSLFRLAESAMRRHSTSDASGTSNISRSEQVTGTDKINSQKRNAKVPEMETETNPIDRAVAHLLFYRPLELSGKHPETPESPASTKLPCEHKMANAAHLSTECYPETPKSKQTFSCSLVAHCKENT